MGQSSAPDITQADSEIIGAAEKRRTTDPNLFKPLAN
jgi:hypothetical protein